MQELNGLRKEDLLNSPEYFFCRKFECRMSRKACVMRQEARVRVRAKVFTDCQDCIQGDRIKKEFDDEKNTGDASS